MINTFCSIQESKNETIDREEEAREKTKAVINEGSGENSMYQLPTPSDYSSGHESVTPNEQAPSPWMNQRPLGVDVNVGEFSGIG
ncbi:hypothetical protein IFM89_014035 [Coptis chinensis]|uniref:Uncharacterized protein n=1 Tax=Coptis chinensis TaxID=261450 RepID=A0A835I267_9MAGN|nr:hypothetical protein IFM89_014035 [Coptis chinensis]